MKRKLIFTIALTIFCCANPAITNAAKAPINPTEIGLPVEIKLQWIPKRHRSSDKDLSFSPLSTKISNSIHLYIDDNYSNLEYAITTPKGYVLKSGSLEQNQDEVVSIEDLPKGRYVLYIYSEDEIWYGYFTK